MRNLLSHRPSRWVAALAVAMMLGTLGTVSLVVAARAAGCSDAALGSIAESSEFTPYGSRLSTLPDAAIGGTTASFAIPANARYTATAIDGLARQYTIASANGSVYAYFVDGDTSSMTHNEFVKLGGLELDQDVSDQSFAAYLIKTFGERAVPIRVGTFDGALTWADPDENGVRTHNLYWYDGTYNYALIGDRSPEALVNIARHLVC